MSVGSRARSVVVAGFVVASAVAARAQLPPPPEPPENPTTVEKALLGKALFWDEQLSSDGTTACGTCHRPAQGGSDPRTMATMGPDLILGTADDIFGSPGVRLADAAHAFQPSDFGFDVQVTPRLAPSFIGDQYFVEQFRDGRAPTQFVDPQTGNVSIVTGGGLESQAVDPPLSTIEMGHGGRDWTAVARRLKRVTPLALSPQLTTDLAAALANGETYPDLFEDAFGDPAITAERIAFALAAYQRTLVPDQTPWDDFNQGNSTALTAAQQRGLNLFTGGANCSQCHVPPLFSDDLFHNIGVRPGDEDPGRENVTGVASDRGRFRTPSLRNVGLRPRLTHRGTVPNVRSIVNHYEAGGAFFDNLDPLIVPLHLSTQDKNDLIAFVRDALTDPRVAAETAPFDRPTLHSELAPPNPEVYGVESAGSGGAVPQMLASSPPYLGNDAWAMGVAEGLGGAAALLVFAPDAANPGDHFSGVPLNVALAPPLVFFPFVLGGSGDGNGHATFAFKIAADGTALVGQEWFAQWFVVDAAATGGFAASKGARFTFF
jgi:cytochrome c peroxidase